MPRSSSPAPAVWDEGEVDFAIRTLGPSHMPLSNDYAVQRGWVRRCVSNIRAALVSDEEQQAVPPGAAVALFRL
ncbi:MAG: hypothetical protein IT307_07745 [Chloroflexi bacterium]|nr:hypothetical protein [Chloroflexota bacterium]